MTARDAKERQKQRTRENAANRAPRATKKDHEQRIAVVRRLLTAHMPTGEIKRVVAAQFGLKPRTIEGYICRAKQDMLKATGRPREEHQADAYAFYCSVLSDQEAAHRDRLKAQERIDKLLGLESPAQVHQEVSGPGGSPLEVRASLIHELMQQAEHSGGGGYEPEIVDDALPTPKIESTEEMAYVKDDDDEADQGDDTAAVEPD